jgi:hypothetical protein
MRKETIGRALRVGPLLGALLALIVATCASVPTAAAGKGLFELEGAARGVTANGYRYSAISPGRFPGAFPGTGPAAPPRRDQVTVVVRIAKDGDGRVDRWWYLRGSWFIPAGAYDGTGTGLSADGDTLVLVRDTDAYPPRVTRLAVVDTDLYLSHPLRPGQHRPRHAIRRIRVPGDFRLIAVSPDGSTAYLRRYPRVCCGPSPAHVRFETRALDLHSGRLASSRIVAANSPEEPTGGLPISHAYGADGRSYTLYDGEGGRAHAKAPFIQVINTKSGKAFRLDLPGLQRAQPNLFLIGLRLRDGGRTLELIAHSWRQGGPARTLMRIDARRLGTGPGDPVATVSRPPGAAWLDFARTPRRPGNLVARAGTIGRSVAGRPIRLLQTGDPAIGGHLLVFGCIHGDECGVARRVEALRNGCPDPAVDSFVVPDLDPDGTAAGSRLNAHGVDLNRNFPTEWRPGEERPGGPEYPGPRPFSEPETQLAARLIRALDPEVTIWFHEDRARRPLVRAWGPSEPAARRFATVAGMPFRAIPWPAGSAPNWQNHAFPGTASFVVELPRDRPGAVSEARLDRVVDTIAREVAKD